LTGDIKRPIVKAMCSDSNGKMAEISLVFSSISQIRKSVAYDVGDVIFFSASIGECPMDNVVFYPKEVHVLKKMLATEEEYLDSFIKSRLISFSKEKNLVMFEGSVYFTNGSSSSIEIDGQDGIRGDCVKKQHIWVKHPIMPLHEKERVLFVGEVTKEGLVGTLHPCV